MCKHFCSPCARSSLTHLAELIGNFVAEIEPALAHFDPVPDHMAGLVRVLGGPKSLSRVIRRPIAILVQHVERLDDHSRNHLDLVIEDEHVGIALRILTTGAGDIRCAASDGSRLAKVAF
jgi:hypothetical protein